MPKILLIDDDGQFRRMLKTRLERAGFDVFEADDGDRGIKLFRSEPVDLVITDIVMPDQEGFATISALRRISPVVKIVAVSGGGIVNADSYLPVAKKLGAARTFPKPLDWKAFLETIRELLEAEPRPVR